MDEKTKILLAEDEAALGQIVKESLETRYFSVLWAKNGREASEIYREEQPELLVLDVMMPEQDGFSLAKEIRKNDRGTPIIFLTAKSQTADVVEGFGVGGNDYLKKPFSMEELIVRMRNLLNRNNSESAAVKKIGYYDFHYPKQILRYKEEEEIRLTHREAELLFHLYKHKNEIMNRNAVLKKIWGDADFFSARSMDVYITKLRKKLKKDKDIQILNVRGFGYKLVI